MSHLLPILDNHPLITSKSNDYWFFTEALKISNRTDLTQIEKIYLIESYRGMVPFGPSNLIKINKDWLIGFTEASGSFYITKKEENRYSHGFGISQTLDKEILQLIR